ncbi:hypothetical protein K1T71_012265 [Dendrolimus kikuchii]|uniref:Uncharacterized protein n=1 Tax=Dendrolimus kikuchii TaxID=765133 RepID=A0ACC1CL43_9NEOP|nr:hypothetical protein K1T71_012265 [Dendrolimus kikuchii]
MAAKSPTLSLKSREMIGVEQFSQRREMFDKQDEAYVPLPSPTGLVPAYKEVEPIITSNHGKTTSNFKRNTAGYSSMRESKTDERNYDFRPRKYSDNFTSELNQSDDVDYRRSMTERTRRLSKMRRDFMTSNLHEPGSSNTFSRAGTRASMPTNTTSTLKYKIESPNLYKFPFAEPYLTPTPVRKVMLDLGPTNGEVNGGKENEDPDAPKYRSFSSGDSPSKIDHQKLFEELIKRYSPQRKPIDWKLPPTKPRVIASVPKSNSSATDSVDGDRKLDGKDVEDEVFEKNENQVRPNEDESNKVKEPEKKPQEIIPNLEIVHNGRESLHDADKKDVNKVSDSKTSLSELDEKNDIVPELATRLNKEEGNRPPLDNVVDLSIPALIQKMQNEGENLEKNNKSKKVKRKRSFLDKLLGRNKDK